jgi:hypothetical protein
VTEDGQNRGTAEATETKCCYFCLKDTAGWRTASYFHRGWVGNPAYDKYNRTGYVMCTACQGRPAAELKEIIVMAVEREVAVASGSKLSLDEKLALVSNLDPDLRRAIDAAREADQRRKKRREEKKARKRNRRR